MQQGPAISTKVLRRTLMFFLAGLVVVVALAVAGVISPDGLVRLGSPDALARLGNGLVRLGSGG
jgi:hypothetical protein